MIQIALALMVVSLFLFAINRNVFWLYFIIPLFPLAMGSFQPSISSLIANKSGKEVGKVMGYNTSVVSIANIMGPFLVGTFYAVDKSLPFFVSSGIAALLFGVAMLGLNKK